MRSAIRPSLSSAAACVNVLAAAQAASGSLGPREVQGLFAGLQGLSSLALGGVPQHTPGHAAPPPPQPPMYSPATPALNAGGYAAYGDPIKAQQQQQLQQQRPYASSGGYAPQEDAYGGGYPGSGLGAGAGQQQSLRYPGGGYGGGGGMPASGGYGGGPPAGVGVQLYGGHYPGAPHNNLGGSAWGSQGTTPHY